MKTCTLTSEERRFLGTVAQAAFANPFSDERVRLDLEITGLGPGTSRDRQVDAVVAGVRQFLAGLDRAGKSDIRLFTGDDRAIVQTGCLFEVFHDLVDAFDALILAQVAAEDAPCRVDFAPEALQRLAGRGFTRAEAIRYFAIFYQLRRAYYFVAGALVGHSPCMKELRRALWDNVFTRDIRWYERYLWNRMEDFSTLLLGETGTGKGAAAAAIGRSGFIPFDASRLCFHESFLRNFIPINLSQYPETLIESELFGHRKGAFTGAIGHHEGVFARCSPHGAIFLDEIGDVPVPVQIKLLQVLQERTFSPVGSHDTIRFRGRVIAATNRPLDQLRREGRFRDDFFYRLCSDVITIPPLRQRLQEDPGELDELLDHVVTRLVGGPTPGLTAEIRDTLLACVGTDYAWPGNVRELEQAARRILLTRRYDGDTAPGGQDLLGRLTAGIEGGTLDAAALLAGYCALLYGRHGTYSAVARQTGLDRRTAQKHVQAWRSAGSGSDPQTDGSPRPPA